MRAHIEDLCGFSGHADPAETLRWLRAMPRPPQSVYLTHGEPAAAQALAATIHSKFGWTVRVPKLGEVVQLLGGVSPA